MTFREFSTPLSYFLLRFLRNEQSRRVEFVLEILFDLLVMFLFGLPVSFVFITIFLAKFLLLLLIVVVA